MILEFQGLSYQVDVQQHNLQFDGEWIRTRFQDSIVGIGIITQCKDLVFQNIKKMVEPEHNTEVTKV